MAYACRYYYYHNSGLQQQYVLYGQDSLKAEPVCLLDPNTLSEDGTVALKDATFSDNGLLMAYSLSSGGSDWATIKVGVVIALCLCASQHQHLLVKMNEAYRGCSSLEKTLQFCTCMASAVCLCRSGLACLLPCLPV
jgi:hypothetical protein